MRVPRVTEQQVQIAPLPNARQRLTVSADTFGAQRARHLSQGAEGLAQAGDALARVGFERQAERTEAEAEEAFARWQVAATDTLAGFRGLQGGDAVGAYDAAFAELTGLQRRIGGALGGGSGSDGGGSGRGRAYALFTRQVANRQPAFAAGLERHRDAQSRVYRTAAMEARMQSAVAAGLADPLLGPGAELEIRAVAQQQGEAQGLPPETVEAIALGHISKIHLGRVDRLLAEGRGAEARTYLESHGQGMTAADRLLLDTKTSAVERTAEVKALYQAIATGAPLPASARERGAASEGDPSPVESLAPAAAFGPRATAAQAKAAVQAEILAGSPQAGPHKVYRKRMARLAGVEAEDPRVRGGAADELTAAYERETAALRGAKATAQVEIQRGLRAGEVTPASLPPDLAAVLSESERDELEDWWRTGLAVEPDAALFEALHALFPAFPDEVSLEAPQIARHLSQEQEAFARRRLEEGGAPNAPGPANGSPKAVEGEGSPVRLGELDETLEDAGFEVWTNGAEVPWDINRRPAGTLPTEDEPRETQVAAGIFGDDGDEGGGDGQDGRQDSGGGNRPGGEPEQAAPPEAPRDAPAEPEAAPSEAEEDAAFDEAAAKALADLIEQAADLTGLSEEQIELLGRETLKLIPGVGAPLSYQDGVEALAQARRALDDEDHWAALLAASEGLIELAGIVPVLGPFVRGARTAGKVIGRAALEILGRVRKTPRGRDLARAKKPGGSTARAPQGSVARLRTKSGVEAGVETAGQRLDVIRRLKSVIGYLRPSDEVSVMGLISGGRLKNEARTAGHIVNIQRGGGAAAADAAFERIIREQGGTLGDVVYKGRGRRLFTTRDGTTYTRRLSTNRNGETVSVIVVAPGANDMNRFDIKVRFGDEGVQR
ncbi:hypothetical protein [Algihabitans albus]|uniref:hypothetical protein n=1 Tax=Algihabitans albus TaxID=2164067 RepID=UPI000E5CE3DD|nr:hypothetical protein [Algihabitans albus]